MTSTPGSAARYSTRRLRCSARRATPWQRRRRAIYHPVPAAIGTGNTTNGGIAAYIGRRSDELSHPLTVPEDAALMVREPDLFRSGQAAYGIAEPLITCYEAIMRRRWPEPELGLAEPAWRAAAHTFNAQVAGPHFEAICRSFTTLAGADSVALGPVAAVQSGPNVRGRLARSGEIWGRWYLVWSWSFAGPLSQWRSNRGNPVHDDTMTLVGHRNGE